MILSLFITVSPVVTRVSPDPTQTNYIVDRDNSVTFECEATGIPPPIIIWYKNGMEFSNTTNSRVTLSQHSVPTAIMDGNGEMVYYSINRTLTLWMSEDEDSDSYECMASNLATPGEASMEFTLIVQSKACYVHTIIHN